MKVLILGASGILGTHMRLCVPAGVDPIWHRKTADALHVGADLSRSGRDFICQIGPDVVVNLAGECNVDAVERDSDSFEWLNAGLPGVLSNISHDWNAHIIHVSSQAVLDPKSEYGKQKWIAEKAAEAGYNWTIARLTFVLGIRPMPHQGRKNPLEAMLDGSHRKQVNDRWFSPLFARDAARALWQLVLERPKRKIVHIGTPIRVSRYDIAVAAGVECEAVSHDSFPGLAPRPIDTTYPADSAHFSTLEQGLKQCKQDWKDRQQMNLADRAREIALFLGRREDECFAHLTRGFGVLHNEVAADFRAANIGDDPAKLLEWYRSTEAYIWELSAYHADPGFNYSGMCQGIADGLKAKGCKTILCLGDGIGDLSIALAKAGLEPSYHDLAGSRTVAFARFRATRHGVAIRECTSDGWKPPKFTTTCPEGFDAVVSLDFMEHVLDVPAWIDAAYSALKPGGWFFAQNAFACGSGPDGSIPMHLKCNDKYEQEWDPTMSRIGFQMVSSNWYQKPVGVEVAA